MGRHWSCLWCCCSSRLWCCCLLWYKIHEKVCFPQLKNSRSNLFFICYRPSKIHNLGNSQKVSGCIHINTIAIRFYFILIYVRINQNPPRHKKMIQIATRHKEIVQMENKNAQRNHLTKKENLFTQG
jgi:hypothetical protein